MGDIKFGKDLSDSLERYAEKGRESLLSILGNPSTRQPAPEQKPSQEIDINIVRKQKKVLEGVINLQQPEDLCKQLNNCLYMWNEIQNLREPGLLAQNVQGLYYQPGKIRDQLRNLVQFAEQMDTGRKPEVLMNRGYGSYAFFLRSDMEKLRKIYQPQDVSRPKTITFCVEDILRFLKEECGGIDAVKGIPAAWELCDQLLRLYEKKQTIPKEMRAQVGKLAETGEYLDLFRKQGVEALRCLYAALENQRKAILDSIQEANRIYEALTSVLTEEWFDRLDPDYPDTPLTEMTSEQIKALYQEATEPLKEKVLNP